MGNVDVLVCNAIVGSLYDWFLHECLPNGNIETSGI